MGETVLGHAAMLGLAVGLIGWFAKYLVNGVTMRLDKLGDKLDVLHESHSDIRERVAKVEAKADSFQRKMTDVERFYAALARKVSE